MSSSDYPLNTVGTTGGHGGAREGAGRKPAGHVRSPEVQDFDKARARNEAAKALQNELKYKVDSGQYVSREAVKSAAATTMSGLAQSLRSISDNLEREGVPIEVCQRVEKVIDEAMTDAAARMELMAGTNPETTIQ